MRSFAGILYQKKTPNVNILDRMLPSLRAQVIPVAEESILQDLSVELGAFNTHFFSDKGKSISLAMQGHLFEKEEVQEELSKQGVSFETTCEEEVLLYAFKLWGPRFVERVKGVYSIVLYSFQQQTLFLYADAYGRFPLYWYQDTNHILFSSQVKALLSTGLVAQQPSMAALSAYMQLGFVPKEHSLIKSLHALPPAHYLEARLGQFLSINEYQTPRLPSTEGEELLQEKMNIAKSSMQGFYAMGESQGEQWWQQQSNYPLTPLKRPIDMQTALDHLPALIWLLEIPITDVERPLSFHLQSIAAQGDDHPPLCALGQRLFFDVPKWLENHTVFRVKKGGFSALWNKATHLLPWYVGLRATAQSQDYPWLESLAKELSLFTPQEFNKLAPTIPHFFSPKAYFKKMAASMHEPSLPLLVYSLSAFKKQPTVEFIWRSTLSCYHQVDWQAPFCNPQLLRWGKREARKGLPLLHLTETPSQPPLELDPKLTEAVIEILKQGKLVESGLFLRNHLDMIKHSPQHFWTLVSLECWFQIFLDTPPSTQLPNRSFLDY